MPVIRRDEASDRRAAAVKNRALSTSVISPSTNELHAAVALTVARWFWIFQLKCCLVSEDDHSGWHIIADYPVALKRIAFELLHGKEQGRAAYNRENLAQAKATKRIVVARYEGFTDVFAPVVVKGEVAGYLVCGPLLTEAPTASGIAAQWRTLTAREARATDPEFSMYLKAVLDTLLLEGPLLDDFLDFMTSLAALVAGEMDPARGLLHVEALYERSIRRHIGNKMWWVAEGLVDRHLYAFSASNMSIPDRQDIGLEHLPTHVIAITPLERSASEPDAIEELIRVYSLQRECVRLAHALPNVATGRLGERGAFFVAYSDPEAARVKTRTTLRDLTAKIRTFSENECKLPIRIGVGGRATALESLGQSYDQAVFALQLAMREGRPIVFYEDESEGSSVASGDFYGKAKRLRETFANGTPPEVALVVDQVIRDILWKAGRNLEVMRGYFEPLFNELLAVAENRAVLEPKVVATELAAFERAIEETKSIYDLPAVFRKAVLDLSGMLVQPGRADQRSRILRAITLMKSSLHGIDRLKVAKTVGLSPRYFSRVFKAETGTTFEKYLLQLRLEKARDLLRYTALPIKQVGQEAGFGSSAYFFEAFKRMSGLAPERYRRTMTEPGAASVRRRPQW
jgi:AraC-like DNA-binding protein